MHPTILLFTLLTLASQPPTKDTVKGSIHHSKGESMSRITGKVKVIDANTLEFSDGTRVAPDTACRANTRRKVTMSVFQSSLYYSLCGLGPKN